MHEVVRNLRCTHVIRDPTDYDKQANKLDLALFLLQPLELDLGGEQLEGASATTLPQYRIMRQ